MRTFMGLSPGSMTVLDTHSYRPPMYPALRPLSYCGRTTRMKMCWREGIPSLQRAMPWGLPAAWISSQDERSAGAVETDE